MFRPAAERRADFRAETGSNAHRRHRAGQRPSPRQWTCVWPLEEKPVRLPRLPVLRLVLPSSALRLSRLLRLSRRLPLSSSIRRDRVFQFLVGIAPISWSRRPHPTTTAARQAPTRRAFCVWRLNKEKGRGERSRRPSLIASARCQYIRGHRQKLSDGSNLSALWIFARIRGCWFRAKSEKKTPVFGFLNETGD